MEALHNVFTLMWPAAAIVVVGLALARLIDLNRIAGGPRFRAFG